MEKSEEHRNKWAFGLTVICSIFIFTGWGFFSGFLNFGGGSELTKQASKNQTAAVVSTKSVPSPIENSKNTLKSAFGEISKQYQEFKNSMADVFVPFVTGIEVYERK